MEQAVLSQYLSQALQLKKQALLNIVLRRHSLRASLLLLGRTLTMRLDKEDKTRIADITKIRTAREAISNVMKPNLPEMTTKGVVRTTTIATIKRAEIKASRRAIKASRIVPIPRNNPTQVATPGQRHL